jgi:hypothetical protein
MNSTPSKQELITALSAAGHAHHDYESKFLGGSRDEQWAGWYAAYVLGRLGDFTTPTRLTGWLSEVAGGGDWAESAASYVLTNLGSS